MLVLVLFGVVAVLIPFTVNVPPFRLAVPLLMPAEAARDTSKVPAMIWALPLIFSVPVPRVAT